MAWSFLSFLAGLLSGWLLPSGQDKEPTRASRQEKRRSTVKGLGYGLGIGLAIGLAGWAVDKHGASAKAKGAKAKEQIQSALSRER